MKIKGIHFLTFSLIFILLLSLGACGKIDEGKKENFLKANEIKKEKSSTSIEKSKKEEKEMALEEKEGITEEKKEEAPRSLLTGLPIKKKFVGKRPYAFMFNNIKFAYPQSESSKAGIIYEILAEGGITRLMGVFDYMSGKKIGSARSARHYYVDFAKEFDAFFIHFGQTKYAISEIQKLKMDTLSGLSSEGSIVFYRDKSIKAPHNAFASADGIMKAIKKKGYRTKLDKDVSSHFRFSYDEEIQLKDKKSFQAEYIKIPFSSYMSPYFTYNKGLYTRFAFGTKHIDKISKNTLSFKNIIIQLVNEYNIDKNGYQTMDLIGFSGKGYYITNGRGIPVYWSKKDKNSKTKFYYDKGHSKEILVNTGKTYYAVFPISAKNKLSFKK